MGRSPCCDKVGLKKGPWTPEEDQNLLAYIEEHGHGSWRALPAKAGLQRCGKSCRLRWTNYLRPDIKRGKFSLQEEQTIIQLHALLGNRWSAIATHLPKRTDNEIKNYWNTHLKKRLAKMGIDPVTHKPKNDALLSSDGQSKSTANLSHMAQWESARLEAEARLVRQSKLLRCSSSSSLQQQLGSPECEAPPPLPSVLLNKSIVTPAPPLCLDILKAWSGVWINNKQTEAVAGLRGDLESPTSTLSYYSENAVPFPTNGVRESSTSSTTLLGNLGSGMMKEDREEEWKRLGNSTHLLEFKDDAMPFHDIESSAWTTESLRSAAAAAGGNSNNNEHIIPSGNFVEKLTDLLLNNSGGQSFSEGGEEESDNCDGCSAPSGSGSDYYEDNKNYWNSILNLVNSSPSDSPMF